MSDYLNDLNWVHEQLENAGTAPDVAVMVLSLVETWKEASVPEGDMDEVLDTLDELVHGRALLKSETDEAWIQAMPGFVHTGDIVRVRSDAFTDESLHYHNGRVGKVIGVRSGAIFFRSTDDLSPKIDGARYSPSLLERKVL